MKAGIRAIEYWFPERVLDNVELAKEYPEWSADKIAAKTGIRRRHIASDRECASDLAFHAARKLFHSGVCRPDDIDHLLLCTQSPDYFLPTTACILQDRLGLPTTCGALDFNLGCSGFVYGLSLAKGLIETGQARQVLLLTADTYSKFIYPGDKSVRTLFGDAGAATLVSAFPGARELLGPFDFGTDGSGAEKMIVATGGLRRRPVPNPDVVCDENGNQRTINHLYMNGADIFDFVLRVVPRSIHDLLQKAQITMEEIDAFVLHQANEFMLEHLRKKLQIPKERFVFALAEAGNTVSCTIPYALKEALSKGRLRSGDQVVLSGFGVGYSWASMLASIP